MLESSYLVSPVCHNPTPSSRGCLGCFHFPFQRGVTFNFSDLFLVGGWFANPPEKYAQVKLDHETPNIRGEKLKMFETTT